MTVMNRVPLIGITILFVCLGIFFSSTDSHQMATNTRPIIGVVAVDTNSVYGKTFIPATYVYYLMEAGARVVPIRGGEQRDYYEKMVNYTNGILFPGGSVNFEKSMYGHSAKYIFDTAIQLNQAGDYFPLWGTCMGSQILCYLAAGKNYNKPTDSANISWPVNFTKDADSSRMFSNAPADIKDILSTEPVTQNQHHYSILMNIFHDTNLSSFYKALSTNLDRRGQEFVSTFEAKDFPFYGVQWHPEKNNFKWDPHYDINHSESAVRVSQYMANFFVSEARKSSHRFPDCISESKSLIQNCKRVFFNDGTFNEIFYM